MTSTDTLPTNLRTGDIIRFTPRDYTKQVTVLVWDVIDYGPFTSITGERCTADGSVKNTTRMHGYHVNPGTTVEVIR